MKKNKLLIAPFDDIHIIGVNSTLVDYKLAYYLNEKLNFNFVRLNDILLCRNRIWGRPGQGCFQDRCR